jgi:uncharacterized protein (DUF1697 family)
MRTYIALLRGINVLGKNRLPMKELVVILERLGFQAVETYIQSGNAVFCGKKEKSSALSSRVSAAINKNRGFEPLVLVLGLDELDNAFASNPFPEAEAEPKTLHLGFLASRPKNPDLKALERVRADHERFVVTHRVFYLHAPEGIGRSKLAASAERLLGVPMTNRNWRTVCKVREMAKHCEGKCR